VAVSSSAFVLPGLKKADAGVFSFISGVLGNNKDTASSNVGSKYNSQNISILEAPLSSKFAVGGGDIVIVDDSALEYQAEASDTLNHSDQISSYVVREGDTLSGIAKMFNVSINTILWANDIRNNTISPGQNLVILPVSGIRHVVVSGDTIQSIVKKHNGDLNDVLSFNNLSEDSKIAVGDVVIVPNGDATPVTKTIAGSKTKVNSAPNLSGYFIRPISGGRKTQGIHGYNGVDLAAPVGTNVVASAGGKVIVSRNSGYNGGYGSYVVVSHPNGTQTLYAHLSATAVSQGQNVSQGDLVGYVGNTGRSTGPHIHFEIRGAKNPF